MKKITPLWILQHVTEAILILVIGILFIVFNADERFQNALGIIVGSFIIVEGLIIIASQLLETKSTRSIIALTSGVLLLSLGILIVINPNELLRFIIYFLAIALAVTAILLVFNAIVSLVAKKGSVVIPILQLLLVAIMIAGSVLIFIYTEETINVVVFGIGIACIVGAIGETIGIIYTSYVVNKVSKANTKKSKTPKKDMKPADAEVISEQPKDNKEISHNEAKTIDLTSKDEETK